MHADSDDSTGEVIHDDQDPVGFEDQGLAAKQVDTPKAILGVAEERQPGRATRARLGAQGGRFLQAG